jgi:hypothetical protein
MLCVSLILYLSLPTYIQPNVFLRIVWPRRWGRDTPDENAILKSKILRRSLDTVWIIRYN